MTSRTTLEAALARTAGVIEELEPDLVAVRRDLHRHPEPSWEEHRTTDLLLEHLVKAGLEPAVAPTGTGVLCDIGAGSGPLVAIRADIDALRMPDSKAVPYRSEVEGVCHACGHDVHTAAGLGAALALARLAAQETRDLDLVEGRVRMIFQPAEEAIPGGAKPLCEAGVMDGVRAVFALHCDPSLPAGHLGLSTGPISSAADQVRIVLRGPGGHTARPHRTVDLTHLVGRVLVDLPAGLGRRSDPRHGVNLTFGQVQTGAAPNVIPTEAVIAGSLRATGRASWEAAGPILRELLAGIVEPLGGEWELEHQVGAPPIENDPWAVALVEQAARSMLDLGAVHPTEQSAGGEDFSWYLDHAPGAYVRLGVSPTDERGPDIHSSAFDVDERAIATGARLLAGSALVALHALGTVVR